MKIDLVMWTYNSARTLETTLTSIEKAIPPGIANQKIIVDAHSKDKTLEIARSHGWKVFEAEKKGIPYQANQSLDVVETRIFASFEHDMKLNPGWFEKISPYMRYRKVAVAQGIRFSTNPIMRVIEQTRMEREDIVPRSLDNNLYKTAIIRKFGGFAASDARLQNTIRESGFYWVVDKTVISDHLKASWKEEIDHLCEQRRSRRKTEVEKLMKILRLNFTSILRGIVMAVKYHSPFVAAVYPYWNLKLLETVIKNGVELK